ncbi:hypothetical protein MMC26_003548 [Xylographa opegraphella]|nr:hypothetical protein [Xylographa opegraphella]
MASISSSGRSPSGSIATVAATASSETATSLVVSETDKDSDTCVDEITVNAQTTLSGPKPIYPLPLRKLRDLLKGPTINVFVGQKPYLDLVFSISVALLSYFSPALRTALQSHSGKKYVVFHSADKKAVSWVLRWMLSGGLDKSYANAPLVGSPVDCLSKRLQIVVELGIQGSLQHSMYEDLKKAALKGAVSTNQLGWIFAVDNTPNTKVLGKNLSFVIVDAVLNSEMTTVIPSVRSNHVFAKEFAAALTARKGRLYAKQHHDWEPLSLFQLDFVYAFTKSGHEIRSMVVHDLIRLHYWQCVPDEEIYITYAKKNTEFNDDWNRAEQERLEYRANNKLKSRAAGTTEQQPGVDSKKQEKRSLRKQQPANNEYHTYTAITSTIPSGLLAKPNTHDHTTPQTDKSPPKPATTRRRHRQRAKINDLSSKSGSTDPKTVNTAVQKRPELKAQERVAKDRKVVKANSSAKRHAKTQKTIGDQAVPPPGKRIESDAVLRLTVDGEVERER